MGVPLSIRLDDDVRQELEAHAASKGIGLATLMRDLAAEAARKVRQQRIRAATEAVGTYVAASPQAKGFCEDWGGALSDGW